MVKKLLLFALPVMLSGLLQQLYNAADVVVVGRFAENGDTALAAVGSTGSISLMLLNLFMGLAIGADIVCSNMVGARQHNSLRRAMHTAIALAALSGIFIGLVGIFSARQLLGWMGCQSGILDHATVYMQVYFCGAPFSLLYNFGAGILRSHGDTRRPMYILAITGVINVGLNLVFVIVLKMGVAGVALATVIAQLLSSVTVLWLLFDPRGEYRLTLSELRFHREELGKIVTLGLPCGLNSIVYSISNVLVQSAINTFPATAVAGSTTGSSVGDFVYLIITSLSTACVTFSGQCFGAGKYRRIDKLLATSTLLAAVGIFSCALALTFFDRPVLSLYTTSAETVDAAHVKLMVLVWSYFLLAVSDLCLCCMRGLGRSTAPTVVNVTTVCVSRIGWTLLIFPLLRQPWFLYLCYPVSWISSAIPQLILYRHYRKQLHEREATP